MKILTFLFLLIFTFGCTTQNIKYNRNKILKKYSAEYTTILDNKKIDLETVYLDKDNIQNVQINKQTKELKITQIKLTELFEMKNLNLDSLSKERQGWDKKKIELIIIDGIILTDSLQEITKIDTNAIKSYEIISQEKMNKLTFCKIIDGDVLLITTK